jgi:translation initiation factor 3 subunit M
LRSEALGLIPGRLQNMVGVLNGTVAESKPQLSAPSAAGRTNGSAAVGGSGNGNKNGGGSTLEATPAASGLAVELSAAAAFLESRAPRAGLRAAVEASVRDDAAEDATRALADAFVAALSRPASEETAAATATATATARAEDNAALEGCMQVLLMWLKECGMRAELVTSVARNLAATGGRANADIRLRCIALMYNAVAEEHGELRFALLVDTIQLAAAAGLVPRIVDTVLPSIDRFLKQWAVSVADSRRMYKVCYDALRSANMVDKAFAFNVKQLELYNTATPQELAAEEVQADAVQAIVDAVRLPKLYRFDTLLELSAVKRLGSASAPADSQTFVLLYELLNIFVKDSLDSFLDFSAKNESFLKKLSIDKAMAADKMRLLTFASLGIESQDLSYDVIAKALKIEDSEVEDWVIRAISSGLVDAKINQLRSSVAVYRSTQRMFTREEWQPLSERINIWKENIGDLLTALRETRQGSTSAAAEAFSGHTS